MTWSTTARSCHVRFDPTGRYIFAGAGLLLWRFEMESKAKTQFPVESWVRGIAFVNDGETCITGGYDGRLIWWSAKTEKPEKQMETAVHQGWIRAIAVSPDQTLIASVGNDLVIRIWNATDGKLVSEISGHESHIYNVAFHPDGRHLVTGDLMCNVMPLGR